MTTRILGAATLALTLLATPALAEPEHHGHDAAPILATLAVDRLEHRWRDGADAQSWEAHGWIGGDTDKLWINTKGERKVGGKVERAELQGLWSHMVDEFWDVQAGIRHDFRPGDDFTYGVLGVRGTAPFYLETNFQLFLGQDGDIGARLEIDTDLPITQALILEPSIEVEAISKDIPKRDLGAGFTTLEAGLRLRYEITRAFAPYVGVGWERALGETATIRRHHGESTDQLFALAGLRFWF